MTLTTHSQTPMVVMGNMESALLVNSADGSSLLWSSAGADGDKKKKKKNSQSLT